MTSTQLVPSHFKKFSCIGSECENHCCQGWVVSIDKKTYKKYQNSNDPTLAKNLKRYKGNDKGMPYATIQMKECGTCPFLTDNGLCYIHANYGEEMLSSVCSVFPRVKNIFNDVLEQSLYLSCPEAARIALLDPNPMEFDIEISERVILNSISKQTNDISQKSNLSPHFFQLRSFAIELIQDRTWDLKTRLLLLGFWIQRLEKLEDVSISESNLKEEWANFITTYSAHIKSGTIETLLDGTKGNESRFVGFIQAYFSTRNEIENIYKEYKLLVSNLLNNFDWLNGQIDDWTSSYTTVKNKSEKLINSKEYILENFLVNEIFKDWFPFGKNTMWDHYLSLIFHYTIIKVHFMSIITETNSLDESDIINAIYLYVRSSLHRKSYVNSILEYAKDNQMNDLASVVILLNC
ncbi:flagellin lysine-N-methylase [Bacillus sp. EAC]|uniref:flagellin lysine-N-methylase n=1 Tax=Bacillus sp. EAC TaxID=1978338 RepID=UPI000B4315B3|nr:flagellin lysine-N-methylase [Bacillus sp. EAC]